MNGIRNEGDAFNHWKNIGVKENRVHYLENYNTMLREEF